MPRKNKNRTQKDFIYLAVIILNAIIISVYLGHAFPITSDALNAIIRAQSSVQSFTEGIVEMKKPYIGVNLYLVPAFLLFGSTKNVFQAAQTAAIIFTIVFVYLITKEEFGRKAAALTALVLSFLPLFMMLRWNEHPFIAFNLFLSLLCLQKYRKSKRVPFLYASALITGLCMYVKLEAVLFVASVLGSYFVVKRWKREELPKLPLKDALLTLAFFLVGLSPLIIYNIQNDWATFAVLIDTGTRHTGANLIVNIGIRFQQLFLAVQGVSTSYSVSNLFSYILPLNMMLFLVALVMVFHRRRPKEVFIGVAIAIFTLLSCFVPYPSQPNVIHLYSIIPLAAMAIGIFLERQKKAVIIVLLALFVSLNVQTMYAARLKLTDESWLEDNSPREAAVHYAVNDFVREGDDVLIPPITILIMNMNYAKQNEKSFSRIVFCEAEPGPTDTPVECDNEILRNTIIESEARLLFVTVPPERSSFFLYEENCATSQSVCIAPYNHVKSVAEEMGKKMSLEWQVNDSRGLAAYNIYSIS